MLSARDRVLQLYSQLTDIVALLAELVRRQKLTDDILLQVQQSLTLCKCSVCFNFLTTTMGKITEYEETE